MICDGCHGKRIRVREGRPEPCEVCGGVGLIHCCDGLTEQIDPTQPAPPEPPDQPPADPAPEAPHLSLPPSS
jgi:hypothetical protein